MMKIIVPGHYYQLWELDGTFQSFILHDELRDLPGATVGDIVEILIDRSQYLNQLIPCVETGDAIEFFKEARSIFPNTQEPKATLIVHTPGHIYELLRGQYHLLNLVFVCRSSRDIEYPVEHPGVQTQEVLRALIHHAEYHRPRWGQDATNNLQGLFREALFVYEVRAWRRKIQERNRTDGAHDDSERRRAWREFPYSDVPFTSRRIELLPIGADGHIQINTTP